ncbi:protein TASOR 2-like isoform X2 [Stegostoma tigrinum]|uniref:protein TASOR 2-like isoform X2 n=1 Tax=Stegostoma tigrinum TaxID=3053191 RepID=UPI002870952C|nr:protein TASOR 2-like isoform X2 [Stegostoma tigrinum]
MSSGRSPSCEEPCPSTRDGSPPETFRTVSLTSSQFRQEILPTLQQGYLDSSSRNYFHYNQVTLVSNAKLLDQYNACRSDLEAKGYNQEELAESFAFLLFETEDQAKTVCEEGLKVGSSNITTLGDPLKGVYLCKYSDFLHPKPWYHGKCGFIAIFKIIKGRVKSMIENYTADLTEPSAGYNCHVSINSDTVSSITSHFQAFELTQYYVYEFGQCGVLQRPRQIYPFSIVAFQYSDDKCVMVESVKTELFIPEIQVEYYPWKGQLTNRGKVISVALKSNGSPLLPVVLPTKLEIEYMMSIGDLQSKLPQGVFEKENYKFKEVCLEGLYCSWYELVADLERGEATWLDPLINNLEEKRLAVVKHLNDQGLLILFSDSVSSPTNGSSQTAHDTVQAVFIFKTPRISHLKETNRVIRTLSQNRITQVLPGYTYAVTTGLTSTDTPATPWNKVVEDQLVEYFKMTPKQSTQTSVAVGNHSLISVGARPNKGQPPIPGHSQQTRLSQLIPYFADPASYSLPVSRVLKLKRNALKLCHNSGGRPKVLCHSGISEPQPPNAGIRRVKRASRVKKVQGKDALPVSLPVPSVPSQPGIRVKSMLQSQASGEPGKTVGRVNSISKPNAVSKVSNRAKRKPAKALHTSALNKPDTILASPDRAVSSKTAGTTSASLGYSTRSTLNSKRTLLQSAKGFPTETPAPLEVNTEKLKAATVLSQTCAAGRADSSCMDTEMTVLDKVPSQCTDTVCVTGVNTQQVSRYGVCTWNIVGNVSDNEPASLQSLSLCDGLCLLQEKKIPELERQASQEGVDNKLGQTDALNILADLAINSAIATVPTSQQHSTLTMHQASVTCAANGNTSVGSSEQLNHCSNLLDKLSDCLPNTELKVQSIMSMAAENHQEGGREASENWLPLPSASSSSEGLPTAAPAFAELETTRMPKPQSRVARDTAYRSSATPRTSHPLGDHSYSRPPRHSEPVCSAVANSVPTESEPGMCQYMSQHGKNERRDSAVLDLQNASRISQSQTDFGSKDEERTLVGRVLPFRREDPCETNDTNTVSAPEELKNNGALGRYSQVADFTVADSSQCRFYEEFQCSRCIYEEKDTMKVTFEWKGPYLYQWDSKYTNDSLEKSVNRALHGPWDPTIQETMKEVKLILHMWIGLFYTKSSEMLQTSIRQVQEHYGTPKPAAEDLHTEPAAVGQPSFNGSGSELAASEKQQSAEIVISSVIKRIEKKSNLVTSCAGRAPFYSETAPCVTSQPDADHPLGGESEINNDNTQDSESLGSSGGLAQCAHISSGKEREQEPKNNIHAAGLEQENQEPSLSPRITDDRNMTDLMQCNDVQDMAPGYLAERSLVDSSQTANRENGSVIKQTDNIQQHTLDDSEATESESPLSQPSTCTASVVEKPKSVDNDDNPELEAREVEIMRQSSVIKEMIGIRLPAKDPAQSTASMNLKNATASPSCEEVNNHSENRLQTEQFDNLAASENATSTEDLGTIKDTLAIERSVPQDTFNGVDRTDAAPQSSPLTIDLPSHTSTLNSSESCNIIIPNYNQSLDSSKTLHNTAGALVRERACCSVESCATDQLLRNVIDTQRRRISVRRLVGEREITSNSDSKCLSDVKSLSPSDESRRQLKPQAIFSQNCACTLKAQEKQEFDGSKDFIATSERSDCGLTESPFTVRDFSESLDIKIKTATRDFSGSKKVPRISCNANGQKIERKRNMHREESEDRDSEGGDFRVKQNSQSGPWHMWKVDMNHSAHILEEEMSDSGAPVPRTIKIPDLFGRPKVYQNFTVTAEMRQKSGEAARCRRITRIFCNWHKESSAVQHSGECNWNANYCRNTSPVEKILNLEYMNFSRDLKNVVNRANAGLFTSPTSYSRDGNKTALRRRNIQMVSSERLTGRGNPLTVTISCQKVEHSNGRRLHNKTWPLHRTNGEDEPWELETVTFSKPKCYTNSINSRKRPCGQSYAMTNNSAEPAERMPRKSCCIREKGSPLHDELLNAKRKKYKDLQDDGRKRTDPFLCLITEFCSNLHQNLSEVVKESWKGTYSFYVFETNSDPFFKEIKEFLKNEGHVEIGLLDLSVTQPPHCGKVLVIIRNEDIAGHLHQIPHLLALKQMPCVQFAGVDSAEDIKDQTFQELFSSGGFVVSDGTVLNNVTPECLQQISSVLEQLNVEHNWKWMIHFKELKKLKETAREDNTAKRKVSLLMHKIAANLVEVLPFHACDSRSREKPDYLSCLMKLQVQKISSRFAVFLTGKLENQDLFALSGILVTDVNSFTKGLRMLTTATQDALDTENAHMTEGGHYSEIQLEPPYGKNKVNQNLQMPSSLF